MEENKKENLTASEAIPGARFQDPRPTDLEVFYSLLPGVLSGMAGKSVDTRSANAMALMLVREMLGQCVAMGIMRMTVQCNDGSPLAMMPAGSQGIPGVAPPIQQQPTQPGQGSMVAQYPNQGPGAAQPGVGGVVQQYPTYSPQQQQQGGRGPVPGQTANIQPIAMFPNGAQPPQL